MYSVHLEPAGSFGLSIVCNGHSITKRVVMAIVTLSMAAINADGSLGSRNGLCVAFGI